MGGGLLHIHMEVEVVVFLVYSFIIYHLSLGRKSYLNRNKSCVPKTKFNIIKIKSMEINKKSPHKDSCLSISLGERRAWFQHVILQKKKKKKKNSMVNNT
jgi:hypothetical protein